MLHELVGVIQAARQGADVNPTFIYICGATEEETAKLHQAFEKVLSQYAVIPAQPVAPDGKNFRYRNFLIQNTMVEFRVKPAKASVLTLK